MPGPNECLLFGCQKSDDHQLLGTSRADQWPLHISAQTLSDGLHCTTADATLERTYLHQQVDYQQAQFALTWFPLDPLFSESIPPLMQCIQYGDVVPVGDQQSAPHHRGIASVVQDGTPDTTLPGYGLLTTSHNYRLQQQAYMELLFVDIFIGSSATDMTRFVCVHNSTLCMMEL